MTDQNIAARIKDMLSTRVASILILLLAIAARFIQLTFFFNIEVDRSFQIQATDSFVRGHGFSLAEVLASDLSTIVYTPLIKWPPGYSLVVAPFYLLSGHNYIIAALSVDILFAILLIVFSRKILILLTLPVYLTNLYTLVTAFFIYEFYFRTFSDAVLVSLFIITLYFTLLFLNGKLPWRRASIILGLLLLLLTSFKYSFIPALFVIPAFLLVKGWADRQVDLKKVGFFVLLIVTVGLGSILLYQKSISGSAAYVSDAVSGFFPENLLTAFPFLSDVFLKPNTVGQLLGVDTGIGSVVFTVLQLLHLLLGGIVLVYMVQKLRTQGFRKLSLTDSFYYLAFFVSLVIFLLLMALSLRIAKDTENWTFIQEGRYYGAASVFIHLAVFVFFQKGRFTLSPLLRGFFYGLLFLLFVEGCRGVFFTFNRIRYFGVEEYSWQYEDRYQKYADGIIAKAKQQYGVDKVAVAGSSYYYNHRIHLYSHVPIIHAAEKINDLSTLNTKEPVVLLVVIHERSRPLFQRFLAQKGGEEVGSFDGHSFYTVYVTPH